MCFFQNGSVIEPSPRIILQAEGSQHVAKRLILLVVFQMACRAPGRFLPGLAQNFGIFLAKSGYESLQNPGT